MVKKHRKDWGQTTADMFDYMRSGSFAMDRDAKRERSSMTKFFHLIRKLDKHMGNERHVFCDKYAFKKLIEENGIKVPETYATLRKEKDWDVFWDKVSQYDTFVMKPNRLSEGRGIHVLTRGEENWFEISGEAVAIATLMKDAIGFLRRRTTAHRDGQKVRNIVIAEERVFSHEDFDEFTVDGGIVDFRMYMLDDEVLYGKMRCPTNKSGGLGNTAKGAIALFVEKGIISDGKEIFKNTTSRYNGVDMAGREVPFWKEIKECSENVSKIFKSPFHSVDLTIGKDGKATVMECEKIPTLDHFKKPEADRLYEVLEEWAQEKLWRE